MTVPVTVLGSQLRLMLPGQRAGRLAFDRTGRLRGPAAIRYNNPFPCVNGNFGGAVQRQGVVMHTMVGNLPGTIQIFNNPAGGPAGPSSAHFGIDQGGNIWQFGPCGTGWIAWHIAAGNASWYGIEHADNGNPDNPLTRQQIIASAQLVEALSTLAGFPLREANSTGQSGYGVHYMGGQAWGGHTCPDLPPDHVRSRQRPVILAVAASIRAGQPLPPITGPAGPGTAPAGPGQSVAASRPPLQVIAVAAGIIAGAFVLALIGAALVAAATVKAAGSVTR